MRSRTKLTSREVEYDKYHTGKSSQVSGVSRVSESDESLIARRMRLPTRQFATITVEDFMSDTVLSNYAELRKKGGILPTNRMTSISSTRMEGAPSLRSVAAVFGRHSRDKHGGDQYMGRTHVVNVPTQVAPRNLLSDRDIQAVQVEALSKLRSQGMDMLTTVAELRQTLAMLAGARRKLIGIVHKAARLMRKNNKKVWTWKEFINEFLSSPWLEARFGWRILYYDLLAIEEYLDKMDEGKKLVVGRSSERLDFTEVKGNVSYQYTDEVKVGYPGTLDLSMPGFASTTNTVWDIIPFSLVVDMFFDVQSRILAYSGEAINVKEHHEASFVTRSQKVTAIVQANLPVLPAHLDFHMTHVLHTPALIVVTGSSKTRVPTTVPPLGLPSFKLSLGGYKPVDLAFLMRIIISKIF